MAFQDVNAVTISEAEALSVNLMGPFSKSCGTPTAQSTCLPARKGNRMEILAYLGITVFLLWTAGALFFIIDFALYRANANAAFKRQPEDKNGQS